MCDEPADCSRGDDGIVLRTTVNNNGAAGYAGVAMLRGWRQVRLIV